MRVSDPQRGANLKTKCMCFTIQSGRQTLRVWAWRKNRTPSKKWGQFWLEKIICGLLWEPVAAAWWRQSPHSSQKHICPYGVRRGSAGRPGDIWGHFGGRIASCNRRFCVSQLTPQIKKKTLTPIEQRDKTLPSLRFLNNFQSKCHISVMIYHML